MTKMIVRRDFLKDSAVVVAGAAIGLPKVQADKSRVVLVRHPDAVQAGSQFNAEVIQQMLDDAVMALLDVDDAVEAFRTLIKPGEIVGIKSNVWSYLPTPAELEQAIKRRVMDAGVRDEDIAIDDHTVKQNPIFQNSTSLINVRPLRTHYLSGVSGVIKNYIMFNASQPALHPNSCEDLGTTFNLPMVKGKTRLNILSCLTPQFHGRGPHHFSRRYVWDYRGLLVSRDPVAVDAIALELLRAKRREVLGPGRELPPVPIHIEAADKKHGIGTSDLNKIELVKLGWEEGVIL
jgi:hypothetical protein